VIVRLTTSGHRSGFEADKRAQNQPLVSTNPIWRFLAIAATFVSPRNWTLVTVVVQVFIVAFRARRQSTGWRLCFGGSPTTITLLENRFAVEVNEAMVLAPSSGSFSGAPLPAISATSGRKVSACPIAHLYHPGHSGFCGKWSRVWGVHADLTIGRTASLEQLVGFRDAQRTF
jgi:hypothetical protein